MATTAAAVTHFFFRLMVYAYNIKQTKSASQLFFFPDLEKKTKVLFRNYRFSLVFVSIDNTTNVHLLLLPNGLLVSLSLSLSLS